MYPAVHAEVRPDYPAMVLAGTGESIGYRDLDRRSVRLARVLRAAGLGPDSCVAIIAENRLEWSEIVWATQRTGMIALPISPRVRPEDLRALLTDAAAAAVITTGGYEGPVGEALAGMPAPAIVLSIGGGAGFVDYEKALAAESDVALEDERLGGRMMVTSGTTGRPKAIRGPRPDVHPAEARPNLGGYTELLEMDSDMVYLSAGPTYHVSPFRFLICTQQLGGTVVEMERFDPVGALEAMARYGVTHAQFVPTMLSRMLALPPEVRARYDCSALRVAITGAAPCRPELKRAICDWWGPVVHELYGSSESYGGTHIGPVEGLRRPGSVGRAASGSLHITDPDDPERELPVGEVGQVWFADGPAFSYVGDEAKTAGSRNSRGWATIGDLGRLDADGYLYLAGRRNDIIISGGVNIHPGPAEDVLATHPRVRDACVVGLPDDDLGEIACAVVVLDPDSGDPDSEDFGCGVVGCDAPDRERLSTELLDLCRERVGRQNSPRLLRVVDELPRNDTGKLDRKLLRARLSAL